MLIYLFGNYNSITSDLDSHRGQINIPLKNGLFLLLYLLHNNRWFRNIFYYRVGPVWNLLIGWWRPGDSSLFIPFSTKIGKGMLMSHAYSTILNADSIGDNFSFIHCTTIGKKDGKRPVIGNNVTLGANVVIIGNVKIGDNVIIDFKLSALMAVYVAVLIFSTCYSNILFGIGKIYMITIVTVIEAVVYIPLALLLGNNFGLCGIVAALLLVNMLCAGCNKIQFSI